MPRPPTKKFSQTTKLGCASACCRRPSGGIPREEHTGFIGIFAHELSPLFGDEPGQNKKVQSPQISEVRKIVRGHRCGIPFQVADVERPLIVVSQLAAAGNKVVLGHKGGYILNDATKKTIKLLRKGGVYILRMWIQDGEKERLVEAVVDSGAEESVIGPGIFPGEVVPSAMSKSGRRYRAANGARIPNLGQLDVFFHTDVEDSVFHRPR